MESSNLENLNKINEGDYVILRKLHDKTYGRLVKVDFNSPFLIGKVRFDIHNLLDKDYGSIYLINNKTKSLDYVEKFDKLFDFKSSIDELKEEENKRDNRSILDNNKSQKLTLSDINNFKEDGVTTKEIIEILVENSTTFNMKTIYSQEKYLKKKQEKYSNYFRVYKPNATLLCDMWFNQGAYKTANIRIDSLALILNLCNVRSGCKYMVVDNSFGLVSAAVLERLVGDGSVFKKLNNNYENSNEIKDVGKCIQIFPELGPVSSWRQAIEALNFKEDHLEHCLLSVQIHKTMPLLKSAVRKDFNMNFIEAESKNDQSIHQSESNNVTQTDKLEKETSELNYESRNEFIDELEDMFRKIKRLKSEGRVLRRKKREIEEKKALELLSKKDINGLIVITKNFNVSEIVDHLLNFLMPSAQLVIFSEFIEPLTQCYNELKKKTCNFRLNELWMRNFQILPMRTRPEIDMFGKSGFILYAAKLAD